MVNKMKQAETMQNILMKQAKTTLLIMIKDIETTHKNPLVPILGKFSSKLKVVRF